MTLLQTGVTWETEQDKRDIEGDPDMTDVRDLTGNRLAWTKSIGLPEVDPADNFLVNPFSPHQTPIQR